MYGIARQGRFASRALRFIPSAPASSSLPRISPFLSRRLPSRPIGQSYFSSISQYRQNAYAQEAEIDHTTANADDFGAEDISNVNREFTKFSELGEAGIIDSKVIDTLVNRMGIHTMTEVQRMTINECLDGTDVIAQARTGTGKTLAFLMPIVQRLLSDPDVKSGRRRAQIGDTQALIISPTRELAEQIATEAKKIVQGTGVQVQSAVGGTQKAYHLRLMQQQGCHILVGTPGRVKDLLSDPYSGLRLDNIRTFVLDEADRLLDIGFGPDIEEIQRYMPSRGDKDRQTLMFSATIPRSVVGVVKSTMKPDFKFVRTVDPDEAATHESIPQKAVFLPGLQNQIPTIVEIAQNAIEAHKRDPANNMPFKAIIFFSSVGEVHLAHEILANLRDLSKSRGGVFDAHPLSPCKVMVMSSQLSQRERTTNSETFRRSESAILVSSDVTARGMDFPNVSHVIQIGLPRQIEDYVHRIGRTGRAGKPGTGWLILQHDERREFNRLRSQINIQNFTEEELPTSTLDMTQPSQLAPETARIMQLVEGGVRNTSHALKARTYTILMSSMQQSPVRRPKQTIVDMVNEHAKFGWGLENPPYVSSTWAARTGFHGVRDLQVRDGPRDGPADGFGSGGRDRGGRGGYGGGRGGGGRFDRDPFGQESRGNSFGGNGGRDGGNRGDRGGRSALGGFGREARQNGW